MPITAAWTAPSTLDRVVGDALTQTIWEDTVGDILYLYDVLTAALALAVHLTSTFQVDGHATFGGGITGTAGTTALGTLTAGGTTVSGNASISGTLGAGATTVASLSSGGAVSGTTGTFSGQVQSLGVNVRRMTGGVSGSIGVPANGSASWSVTLDDAITPTRAVATVVGSNGSVIYNAQVTSLAAGSVSGIVDCNGTPGTVTVHVIAY